MAQGARHPVKKGGVHLHPRHEMLSMQARAKRGRLLEGVPKKETCGDWSSRLTLRGYTNNQKEFTPAASPYQDVRLSGVPLTT